MAEQEQEQPKTTDSVQNNNESEEQPEKEAQKTFTREEIGKIVTAQIENERKQWKQKLADEVAKAKEDGKAEATMSAKELAEKQAKEREEQLKQEQADLEKLKQELDRREHIAHTKDLLTEENLPTDSAELLLGKTEEDTKANIANFKKLVQQGVRNALHKSSAGKSPQLGSPAKVEAPKKNMADMNYEEMQKYIESQEN